MNKNLVTDIVGQSVYRRSELEPQSDVLPAVWKGRPDVNGLYVGIVKAAWIDKYDCIKITIADPYGLMFDTWLTLVLSEKPNNADNESENE